MTILTKDQILSQMDLKHVDVAAPEWGGTVRLREMTAAERDDWEDFILSGRSADGKIKGLKNIRATLVSLCAVDEDGQRLFANEDMTALSGKSAAILERLFVAAQKLNSLTPADLEELEKNSSGAGAGDLPSDSALI